MDLPALKSELTTDPLGRGYSGMSDEAAANRINVIDRPGDGSVASLLNYLLVNKSRDNTGTDLTNLSMLGRLITAANAAVGTNPFGATGGVLTLDMKCSCLALLEICRNASIARLPFQSTPLQNILTDVVNAFVMKNADKTAIIALSNNLQSRSAELGFGHVTASDVADARRLP